MWQLSRFHCIICNMLRRYPSSLVHIYSQSKLHLSVHVCIRYVEHIYSACANYNCHRVLVPTFIVELKLERVSATWRHHMIVWAWGCHHAWNFCWSVARRSMQLRALLLVVLVSFAGEAFSYRFLKDFRLVRKEDALTVNGTPYEACSK